MFRLSISTENAAFENPTAEAELSRILRELADRLEAGHFEAGEYSTLRDANGNTVGAWEWSA